ncbi:Putative uncharacterized protein [Halomonas sp. R57-5]|nr:Putative uncharacterized protein [Halomonas sp. R57-5]
MARHPNSFSNKAVSGQPIVLANPASSVTPVIEARALRPNSRPRVAKAASYSPIAMPTPVISQASIRLNTPWDSAMMTKPNARTTLDAISTPRPPCWSIKRPTLGPSMAVNSKATENAANTQLGDIPSSRAMGTARIAGK